MVNTVIMWWVSWTLFHPSGVIFWCLDRCRGDIPHAQQSLWRGHGCRRRLLLASAGPRGSLLCLALPLQDDEDGVGRRAGGSVRGAQGRQMTLSGSERQLFTHQCTSLSNSAGWPCRLSINSSSWRWLVCLFSVRVILMTFLSSSGASLVAQLVKNLPGMRETWVRSLGWEDTPEKGKATHSSILAWRLPWTIQSMGSQRVRHDWVTFIFIFTLALQNCPHLDCLCRYCHTLGCSCWLTNSVSYFILWFWDCCREGWKANISKMFWDFPMVIRNQI